MKKSILSRLLAVCLCLCMLPVFAVAETNDGTPVTRSDFSFRVNLHPEGFPDQSAAHLEDWQKFLSKLSIEGVADTQSFLSPYSRVYFDGGLCLNGENKLPFVYDGYYSFRYLRSPAFRGEHLHFQMFNFFQFMLKPYYYMGLPTNLIALPIYPEAATEIVKRYAEGFGPCFEGEGDRTVPYDVLWEAASSLAAHAQEDVNDKLYYFFNCLLMDIGAAELVLEKLCYLDEWLDYLDPEQTGLQITVSDAGESWMLGEHEVFARRDNGFTVVLPDDMGYVYTLDCIKEDGLLDAQLLVTLEDEERLNLTLSIDGLFAPGVLDTEGHAQLALTGGALYEEVAPLSFDFQCSRSAETMPCAFRLIVDWLHPETGLPAVGYTYEAQLQELPYTAIHDLPYNHQDDFFHLNESYMSEYKERYLPTIALALTPFVLEMPAGIISDVVAFLNETGLLAVLGIE